MVGNGEKEKIGEDNASGIKQQLCEMEAGDPRFPDETIPEKSEGCHRMVIGKKRLGQNSPKISERRSVEAGIAEQIYTVIPVMKREPQGARPKE
jgi:hypothetical protein